MWFLLQLFYASFGKFFNVGFSAHIGGFIFGVSFAYFIKILKGREVFISPQEEREEEIKREEREIEKKEKDVIDAEYKLAFLQLKFAKNILHYLDKWIVVFLIFLLIIYKIKKITLI